MEPWKKGAGDWVRLGGGRGWVEAWIKGLERLDKIGGREGMGGTMDKRLGETG